MNWSRNVYVVNSVRLTDPVTYKLRDNDGNVVSGLFYRQELQKIGKWEGIEFVLIKINRKKV